MKTSKEILRWLRANGLSTAGLTHTDTQALVTSVNLSNLIGHSYAPQELFDAYGAIVRQMQPQQRFLAYHAIACELDWSNRVMIWQKAGFPGELPASKCKFEQ